MDLAYLKCQKFEMFSLFYNYVTRKVNLHYTFHLSIANEVDVFWQDLAEIRFQSQNSRVDQVHVRGSIGTLVCAEIKGVQSASVFVLGRADPVAGVSPRRSQALKEGVVSLQESIVFKVWCQCFSGNLYAIDV